MTRFILLLASLLALTFWTVFATPVNESETRLTHFASTNNPDVSLRFVADSGVCETTPGVHQMSGYIDVGTNMSMWFWFFESRETPETAPFTLWLNGGPGCSSMIGLFQENGPCQVNPDGATTVLNPFRVYLNLLTIVIYIDQPIGTGFSFGTDTVNSTQSAAPFVWQAFQVLFESQQFSKFQSRELIFATESYGGHYGPAFVTFFDPRIDRVKLTILYACSGWYDPLIQNKAYLDFATNAPGYGQLQPDNVLQQMNTSYFGPGGSDDFCVNNLFVPAVGDRDSDDLRQNSSALFPPEFYVNFLHTASIKKKIGAETRYQESLVTTGDDARTLLPQLGALANSSLNILIWAGDADINCNWLGGYASVLAMDWYGKERLAQTPLTNMTINDTPVAEIANVDNFSFARVYQAGHEVPAFQPQAAFEIFKQVVNMQQLHSVKV
ncbi:alpha/beta-hydrolase [Pholiota molesta]|nr:alpha/beta-hydrolase [Pholiota molesta]